MGINIIDRNNHIRTDDVHFHPVLDRMETYYDTNPSGSIPPNPFPKANQNGNYRRGYQRYIRGGAPKGEHRVDEDKMYEFIMMATKPRQWVCEVLEQRESEWWVKIREENGSAVVLHIPFDETIETGFEWDYEG
jgi:hypothetical protein